MLSSLQSGFNSKHDNEHEINPDPAFPLSLTQRVCLLGDICMLQFLIGQIVACYTYVPRKE